MAEIRPLSFSASLSSMFAASVASAAALVVGRHCKKRALPAAVLSCNVENNGEVFMLWYHDFQKNTIVGTNLAHCAQGKKKRVETVLEKEHMHRHWGKGGNVPSPSCC